MKHLLLTLLTLLTGLTLLAESFDGIRQHRKITFSPGEGHLGMTVGCWLKIPRKSLLLPPGEKRSVHVPFELSAVKPAKSDFKNLRLTFVVETSGGYANIKGSFQGHFPIIWNRNPNSHVPTDKFVPLYFLIGDGYVRMFLNGVDYDTLRAPVVMPMATSAARQYLICLGMTLWRGGKLHMNCEIEDVVVYDRILDKSEIRKLSEDQNADRKLPGLLLHHPLKKK